MVLQHAKRFSGPAIGLHLLESIRKTSTYREWLVAAFQMNPELSGKSAFNSIDSGYLHQCRTVNTPKMLFTQFSFQLFEGLSDQILTLGGDHRGVLVFSGEVDDRVDIYDMNVVTALSIQPTQWRTNGYGGRQQLLQF
jgi:hypothetical protein